MTCPKAASTLHTNYSMQQLLTAEEIKALIGLHAPESSGAVGGNLDVLLDVPVNITVEALSVALPIRDLVNLSHQGLVRLDGPLAQPLRIFANGNLIALGALAVDDGHPALRITEVLPPERRQKPPGRR